MARRSSFDILTIQTNNVSLLWKNVHGIAPDNAAKKLDIAMLDWQSELTKTLKIWIDKGLDMTVGELILARANLGAVVESWLRFFYCVFYDDYINQPTYLTIPRAFSSCDNESLTTQCKPLA